MGSMSQLFAMSGKTIKALTEGPGKETFRITACRICPCGCSLSVRRIDGVPVGIKGNPLSPINRGGACPAAYANLEILYHPDRLTDPLARPVGPIRKQLKTTSWDKILPTISKSIADLVNRNEGYKIAIINGDDTPLMQEVWQNFANTIGTPNLFQEEISSNQTNAVYLSQGLAEAPKFDIINSEVILNFGANILEEDGAMVHFNQVISRFKDLGNVIRNKMIYVGPRANITAVSAHKWHPLIPDTWGTLALGLAHILIDSHSVEVNRLRKDTQGFSDWTDSDGQFHAGFESMVMAEFHPKRVEEITGIPEVSIREMAERVSSRERSAVICGNEALQSPRGDLHQWAVHCLNYIIGAIQSPGGLYFRGTPNQEILQTTPYQGKDMRSLFFTDGKHPLEKASLDIFAKRVEGYSPYDIDLLIINRANPVYYGENRTKWKILLKHLPRVIYIGDLPNETSAHADVILPIHTPFETWDVVEAAPGIPVDAAVLQRPVIDPMYSTRSSYDLLRSIAEGAGLELSAFPAKNAKGLAKKRLEKIFQGGTGQLFTQQTDDEWKAIYQSHLNLKITRGKKPFLKELLKTGGWWDPAGPVRKKLTELIHTRSGKFEFITPLLYLFEGYSGDNTKLLQDLLASKTYPVTLEKYTASEANGYPLTLISGFPLTNPGGRTVYSTTLVETIGAIREIHWESWVEINPVTARRYDLEDGMKIQLDSPVGEIKVRARIRPLVHPDVVYIPMGLGRENVGRYTSGIGSDPRNLMVPQSEVNTGNMILSGTPVRITI